jgi:hypothetical protein
MVTDARGAAPADSLLPTPAPEIRSLPLATVKGEDQGEAVLNNWTYTKRPISISF